MVGAAFYKTSFIKRILLIFIICFPLTTLTVFANDNPITKITRDSVLFDSITSWDLTGNDAVDINQVNETFKGKYVVFTRMVLSGNYIIAYAANEPFTMMMEFQADSHNASQTNMRLNAVGDFPSLALYSISKGNGQAGYLSTTSLPMQTEWQDSTNLQFLPNTLQAVVMSQAKALAKDIKTWYPLPNSLVTEETLREILPSASTYKLFVTLENQGVKSQYIYASDQPFEWRSVKENNPNGQAVEHEYIKGNKTDQKIVLYDLGGGFVDTVSVMDYYKIIYAPPLTEAVWSQVTGVQQAINNEEDPGATIRYYGPDQDSGSPGDGGGGGGTDPSNPSDDDAPRPPTPPEDAWDIVGWVKYIVEYLMYIMATVGWIFMKVGKTIGSIFTQSSGFIKTLSEFFSWLPSELVVVLVAGLSVAVLLRIFGR